MTEPPWRLVVLSPLPEEALRGLLGDVADRFELVTPERSPGAALAAVTEADLVLGDFSSQLRITPELVAAADRLGFVQQPTVGVDSVDLAACAARSIPVANTAGVNSVSVAEWCVLGALAACRSAAWGHEQVRAGGWPQLEMVGRGCVDLEGRRVGILGYGPIGVACAQRFAAFDCPVSYWSRTRRDPQDEAGAIYRDLDDLLATSDVLVIVVALAPETRGLLDRDRLALLPAQAVVVNAARGGIVDEDALCDLLDAGHLIGAALDVYADEPPVPDARVRTHDRVFLSPHISGGTLQSQLRIMAKVQANLRRVAAGEPVHDVVNGVDPLVRWR